ncbi:MAG: GlgB N-terminal domain-containing protein, partial [Rhizomicrobium sp.]
MALAEGRLSDPFSFLGPHETAHGWMVRCFLPGALAVEAFARDGGEVLGCLAGLGSIGLFAGPILRRTDYVLRIRWPFSTQESEDPYSFGPLLGDLDLHLFSEGSHWQLAERLGAAAVSIDGVAGVRFAVWAPNARRVSVVGDFNSWDGRRHPMRLRHTAGVWELFVPRLGPGERYKYEIMGAAGDILPLK